MQKISEVFSFLFAALITIWIGAMILAANPCERAYKSSLPWTFSIGIIEKIGQNWMEVETRISLLRLKADGAVFIQKTFLQTAYGPDMKCKI
jgi:hypothetical protein